MGFPVEEEVCPRPIPGAGGDGGTSSPGSGSSSNTPGGGTAEPIEPIVVTVPVVPPIDRGPCNTLRKTLKPDDPTNKNGSIKSKIQSLQAGIKPKGEDGMALTKNSAGTYGKIDGVPVGDNNIKIKTGGTAYGRIHTHPTKNVYPIFSFRDVIQLFHTFDEATPSNIQETTSILVVKDLVGNNQVYALTIDDFIAFQDFLENKLTETEGSDANAKIDLIGQKLVKKYRKLKIKT
jgi:hypothetical protein